MFLKAGAEIMKQKFVDVQFDKCPIQVPIGQ